MALEILALNPATKHRRKKRGKKAKGDQPMARKKRRGGARRGRGRSRRSASIARLHNPGFEDLIGNPPSRARRIARRGGQFLGSSGIAGAAKSMLPMLVGAIAAKIAQKKFGDKTEETGNWTWKDYLTGAAGTLVAGLGTKYLFKANPATSQKVLEGGFLILAFKLLTNELVPKSDTAKEWLGAEGGDDGIVLGGDDEGSWAGMDVGDLYESQDGQTYVLGADGFWRPWDSSNRALPPATAEGFGETLSPPGRLGGFGETLSPPGRLGGIGIKAGGAFDQTWF
jgi:hypothetical protein